MRQIKMQCARCGKTAMNGYYFCYSCKQFEDERLKQVMESLKKK